MIYIEKILSNAWQTTDGDVYIRILANINSEKSIAYYVLNKNELRSNGMTFQPEFMTSIPDVVLSHKRKDNKKLLNLIQLLIIKNIKFYYKAEDTNYLADARDSRTNKIRNVFRFEEWDKLIETLNAL